MRNIIKGLWRLNDPWKYTNIFWYIGNILGTLLCIVTWLIRPSYRGVLILRELYFLRFSLPKKDQKFYETLVFNYEQWVKRIEDIEAFKKKYWLNVRAYEYCKLQLKNK